MEERLSLLAAAVKITRLAVLRQLGRVPPNALPPSNLPLVIWTAPSQKVSAVPLKPAPRILVIDPSLRPPYGKGLRRVDAKKIHFGIVSFAAQFGGREPILRKLCGTVSHVFTAEYTKLQHLLWREFRAKVRVKVPPHRLRRQVHIALLHQVVDLYSSELHHHFVGHWFTFSLMRIQFTTQV